MAFSLKFVPSAVLLAVVLFYTCDTVTAGMSCSMAGLPITCPIFLQDDSKQFCCYSSNNIGTCCDIFQYLETNPGIIAGVVAAVVVLLLLCTLCCCCCCSCCLLAKRRQRGHVMYTAVVPPNQPVAPAAFATNQVNSTYPLQSIVHSPPPSYTPGQPAYNPNYGKPS